VWPKTRDDAWLLLDRRFVLHRSMRIAPGRPTATVINAEVAAMPHQTSAACQRYECALEGVYGGAQGPALVDPDTAASGGPGLRYMRVISVGETRQAPFRSSKALECHLWRDKAVGFLNHAVLPKLHSLT
jgi:hypothetical protein